MADTAELKHMVMSFRVSELQVLLGYVGCNKTGRKTELLQRALKLVARGCSVPVQIKIRELYKRKPSVKPGEDGPMGFKSEASWLRAPLDYSTRLGSDPLGHGGTIGIPVHPDVKMKHLPFYDCITELMKISSLVPRGTSKFQECSYNFHLSPQQAQDIAMSRDFRPGAKFDYTTQIQLRFCLLETSCEQDDHFPPGICVRINGKMAPLPNPIPTNKPNVEPKRPGRPVDITPLCRLSPTMPNQVEVSWATDFGRGYCVAIFLVKKLSSDILLSRLKQFGNRHADHTRALIKEKLSHDTDSEIATTSLRVSLLCPLGKMRMMIPSRASTCTHLQCFDASTFLMMNEKKSTWICPVCDKPAPFHKLFIDGLFIEIIRQSPEINDIKFHEDGSWSPLKASKTHVISCSPMVNSSKSRAESSSSSSASPAKKPKMEVIDLTISSDEDDSDSDTECGSPAPTLTNTVSDSSPAVINLDSPNPGPSSVSLSNSPMVASPSSHSNSSNSSSSSSNSSSNSSSGGQKSPSSLRQKSPSVSVSVAPPISSPSSLPSRSPAGSTTVTQSQPGHSISSPLSIHTSPVQSPASPIRSPLGARISPVTPPTTTPILPPFQPIAAPVSLSAAPHPTYNTFPTMTNFDPNLDREIEDFLRGIVWEQYR